jgi:Zn-finger nucleic acid-binding protein
MQAGQLAASSAWSLHSERRERRLRHLVESRTAPLTPETVARFMGDRRDVDAPERERNMGAIPCQPTNVHCAVVLPAKQRALVGIDRAPSCEGTWADMTWTWDGKFTTTNRTDITAPQTAATKLVHEAAKAYESSHDVKLARASIERAVGLEPDDPSLRLTAAWLAMEDGAPDRAIVHVHAGLATETETYRRGQFLLWGARAARKTDAALADKWTVELLRLSGPHVEELKVAAKKKYRGKPHVNFMMADAY